MIKSWHNTIGGDNTLVLGIDIGDPSFLYYKEERTANKVICKANSTVTEVINSIWAQYPDYDFYHITNDDVIYHTPQWDVKMANILKEKGGGIAYGNDLFQGAQLPTFPFISKNVLKGTRYLQLPSLVRYCGDTVFHDIGVRCGCLYYLEGVVIEHLHKLAGKGKDDVDMDTFQKDWHSYVQWHMMEMQTDVDGVKEAMNGIS